MSGNITFTMIKPETVCKEHTGPILAMISKAGFWIKALKMVKLTKCQAEEFYAVHKERPFFSSLVEFMSSRPIVAAILEKENAVEDYRKLVGATDPAKATEGTIRQLFGISVQSNAVHGSDSDDNALIESNFFFSHFERFECEEDCDCGCNS